MAYENIRYLYGIWKAKKRSLRWISGVKKPRVEEVGPQEGKERRERGKPRASLAGVGNELVGVEGEGCGDARERATEEVLVHSNN